MDYLERNYHLIKDRMIQQMELSIKKGKNLIDTELDTGLLNFIVRPLVKLFYENWAKNDIRDNTLKQIYLTLDAGIKLLKTGISIDNFNQIVKESLPKYIQADQTSLQCNKHHKNYVRIIEVARETFINYLKEVVKLLEVEDDVEDYGDLCRVAFKTKKDAEENLMNQLSFTDRGIKIVEEDPSILKIPVGRRIIIKILRKGFLQTKKEFFKSLNETYNPK
ncbi:MAG: hypothetical protein KGD58_12210 [Candidatus Lokiarchaeota archaeon]|nr:hypothetical protein [Candidatus Lokiarchaeota archaeon]